MHNEEAMDTATNGIPIVNDVAITIATVNGSGSQTANTVLLRAIFEMGIPVSGKNLFPSNIQGEPTWYVARANHQGYTSRPERPAILVAFNPRTAAEDIQVLLPGGICICNGDEAWRPGRDDVQTFALPVHTLLTSANIPPRSRAYAINMLYVGALAGLIGIDMAQIRAALQHQFPDRPHLFASNITVVEAAFDWIRPLIDPATTPYRLERMPATPGRMLIDGNRAAALGAIFGGVGLIAWYPITPATSLADALAEYLPRLRRDADGHATYAMIQAEDEIAALGMVLGAGWAGARAMTSTSGPGISLMSEFAGLGYFAEVPAVIWDVQRVGPSTGLPTRTSQGDLLTAYSLGHGDTRHVVLLPANPAECFSFGAYAFDLAERLQTPVFVLSDLDLGMNLWMSEPFDYPQRPMDRGKVLRADDLDRIGSFTRFADPDGDGIGYRTLPGNPHPLAAMMSRGTGHNEQGRYSERAEDWEHNLDRLARKHETARQIVPAPIIDSERGSLLILAYGSSDAAIAEARAILRARGLSTSYVRIRALPLAADLRELIAAHDCCVVVDQNYDGQMAQLLQLHAPDHAARIRSLARIDGLPLNADRVAAEIERLAAT
jgi:2-oxoglutarate ferredoxin oxidoreductase subunit alpha